MTLRWPNSRNSFHPAWLLLILPPLISVLISVGSTSAPQQGEQYVRLALALLVTAPLIWWRSGDAGAVIRRLLKELRIQMPGFLVATGVPGLLGLVAPADYSEWSFFAYAFGCALMGATALGVEYEHRTLSGLLSQPRTRRALYVDKLSVLGVLLGLAATNQLALQSGVRSSEPVVIVQVAVFAFCSGPFFSLLSRSTLAGMVFSAAVPLILTLAASLLTETLIRWFQPADWTEDRVQSALFPWACGFYLVATFLLGWRQFKRLEVRDSGAGGKAVSSLHPLSQPADWLVTRLLPHTGSSAQLLRKELRLQVIPWFVAGIMVGLWLIWMILGWSRTPAPEFRQLDQVSGATLVASLLGVFLILGTSAASIAEERELGTLEWQLTQPISIRQQWWTKVAVTGALALGLGLGLPWLLLRIWFGAETLYEGWSHPGHHEVWAFVGGSTLLLSLGLYASSTSRNTMGAVATTVGLGAGLIAVESLCGLTLGRWMDEAVRGNVEALQAGQLLEAPTWSPSQSQIESIAFTFIAGLIVLTIGSLLGLAAGHFRRARRQSRRVVIELGTLTAGLVLLSLASGSAVIHLAQRHHQAESVQFQLEKQQLLVRELEQFIRASVVPKTVYQHFGVPETTEPGELIRAIQTRGGPVAVDEIVTVLRTRRLGPRNTLYLNELASRYGLPVLDLPTNQVLRMPQVPGLRRP